ncbi:MAG: hypothetical protein ABL927_03105 [Bdellovibrionales bacterium]
MKASNNSLNWKTVKKAMYLVGIAFVLTSSMACSSKSKDRTPVRYVGRVNNNQIGNMTSSNGQQNTWGYLASNDPNFSSVLQSFMYGVSDLGYVSASLNASTGIAFRASISAKRLDMLVWDDKANAGQGSFYWSFQIVDIQQSASNAVVVAKDNIGTITLNGNIVGSTWQGSLMFQNSADSNGAQGSLGSFSIPLSALN